MNQITRSRERAHSLFSIMLIAAVFALSASLLHTRVAWAEDPAAPPPAEGGATSGDTGNTSATDTSTGTGGGAASTGGDGAGTGGEGAATGGGNTAGNGTESSGGSAAATGGTSSADGAGTATSTNTTGTPTDAGPGSTTSTNTVTDDQTGGATGGTGSTTAGTSTSATGGTGSTNTTGAGNPGVTPATPNAPDVPSIGANAAAGISTGDATAIGNMSQTEIVQIVIAIVNITMPNVNAADIVGPLVTINQTADVVNAGIANAMTGGNTAVASLISTVAGGGQVSAQQLAGLATTGSAEVGTGSATAVGNLSWTEVMQIASVITSVNGDASLTQQLTEIHQSASVTNAGQATADTGGNSANVSVSVGNDDPGDPDPGGPSIPLGAQSEADPYPGEANPRVLLWGPAPSADAVVWIYVDGRQCKTANIEPSVDFRGAFDWWTYVYPGECGAKNGSEMTFLVGQKMKERITFNNKKRESPQITFQALLQAGPTAQGGR